ncbi:hypothetical protein I315_06149 [Cryptococcus gattii Ru294]|nr:hypothetical protein I315_06149 [Cryptococcus gattii Ru294]
MSSIWRFRTVPRETHVDAEEEEDEPIEDYAMQPVSDSEDAESNPYFGPVAGSCVIKALPPVDEVQYRSVKKSTEMVDAFFQELISVVFVIFALSERAIVTSRAWKREMAKAEGDDDGQETVLLGEAEAGVIWYERAQTLHYTTLKDVNIHQVQCHTLLAAFQASVNAMPMSWLVAGQAIRAAQDLGLHRSATRLPLPFAEKQRRSRCWWAIYGLERMMSVSLGRPLGVDDLDVDVAYPLEVDDTVLEKIAVEGMQVLPSELENEPETCTMSGLVALTKLCKIAGRVVHLLYGPSKWESLVHCVDATRSVIHIASQSYTHIPPSHHLAIYCQYLWSSAVTLLLCEIQARDEVLLKKKTVDWQKRQRMFEVSDTRTPSNEDEPAQGSQAYYSMYPMTTPTTSQARHQPTGPMPTYDMVFDLGVVTFDGLELLQGFNGDASNFWNNFDFGMDVAGYGITSGGSATWWRFEAFTDQPAGKGSYRR